jgi:hypothetical protein
LPRRQLTLGLYARLGKQTTCYTLVYAAMWTVLIICPERHNKLLWACRQISTKKRPRIGSLGGCAILNDERRSILDQRQSFTRWKGSLAKLNRLAASPGRISRGSLTGCSAVPNQSASMACPSGAKRSTQGKVFGQCMKRHRHQEFTRLLNLIDASPLISPCL